MSVCRTQIFPPRHRRRGWTLPTRRFKNTIDLHETIDYWFSREFGDTPNPVAALMMSVVGALPSMNPEFRAKHDAAAQQLPALTPVRSVHTSTTTDGKGKRTKSVSKVEIDAPVIAEVTAATFDLPEGFTRKRK